MNSTITSRNGDPDTHTGVNAYLYNKQKAVAVRFSSKMTPVDGYIPIRAAMRSLKMPAHRWKRPVSPVRYHIGNPSYSIDLERSKSTLGSQTVALKDPAFMIYQSLKHRRWPARSLVSVAVHAQSVPKYPESIKSRFCPYRVYSRGHPCIVQCCGMPSPCN